MGYTHLPSFIGIGLVKSQIPPPSLSVHVFYKKLFCEKLDKKQKDQILRDLRAASKVQKVI